MPSKIIDFFVAMQILCVTERHVSPPNCCSTQLGLCRLRRSLGSFECHTPFTSVSAYGLVYGVLPVSATERWGGPVPSALETTALLSLLILGSSLEATKN